MPVVTPSPLEGIDDIAQEVTDSATHKEKSRLKELCLKRDNFCCAITSAYAAECRNRFPVTDDAFDDRCVDTNASHIIPFALGRSDNRIWTSLFSLFPGLKDVMRPNWINEPRNVITMSQGLNIQFRKLSFALESTL